MKSKPTLPELSLAPSTGRLWVAYSGGLDSTVLLHRLAASKAAGLRAVHIHHGLQEVADDWVKHCRKFCRALAVPLKVLRIQVPPRHADGPEAAARAARYAALRSLLRKGDVLATAHHQDDQAETVLLRLLRGAGIAGLAGIGACAEFSPGLLWRPLLKLPRASLRVYAEQQGLSWIEDPHNSSPRYARSYLRKEIMPRLLAHWPQAQLSLARTARLAAEAAQLLDDLARQDLAGIGGEGGSLSVAALLALPPPRRNNLLRQWLARKEWAAPAAETWSRLEAEVLRAKPDAQPLLHCGDYEFRRYRDRLFLMAPLPPEPGAAERSWPGGTLELPPGCGRLSSKLRFPAPLQVRFARGGEKLKPACGGPTRTLRNLFQERGVPPWVRSRTPLVYRGGELLAVGDYWLSDAGEALGLKPAWQNKLPGAH